jgi:hypothetical protein
MKQSKAKIFKPRLKMESDTNKVNEDVGTKKTSKYLKGKKGQGTKKNYPS